MILSSKIFRQIIKNYQNKYFAKRFLKKLKKFVDKIDVRVQKYAKNS